jgi:hypothetical protein
MTKREKIIAILVRWIPGLETDAIRLADEILAVEDDD